MQQHTCVEFYGGGGDSAAPRSTHVSTHPENSKMCKVIEQQTKCTIAYSQALGRLL